MKCGTCRFWQPPADENSAGECRRNPPLVMIFQGQGIARGAVNVTRQGYFPPAASEWWCGSYEPRVGLR